MSKFKQNEASTKGARGNPYLVFFVLPVFYLYHGDVAHRAVTRFGGRITALRTLVHSFFKKETF